MLVNIIPQNNCFQQPQWRSFEREGAEKAFGEVVDAQNASHAAVAKADAIRWFPPSEEISNDGWSWMIQERNEAGGVNRDADHINDAYSYENMHDKLLAMEVWSDYKIPTVPHFKFTNREDFYDRGIQRPLVIGGPFLLRLNNSVAGQESWLVSGNTQIGPCLEAVLDAHRRHTQAGRGVGTSMFCAKFIDTRHPDYNLNCSYRIIVAGGKVVTGYARVSDPNDWVAVTNKFHSTIADAWMYHNRRCQQIMIEKADLLVRAVECLGLNHQGLDLIEEPSTGNLYFLETQTTYDAGFIGVGHYCPPYYNPYNPELLKFIGENKAEIERDLPLYYNFWLDKRAHFERCYQNLADSFKS